MLLAHATTCCSRGRNFRDGDAAIDTLRARAEALPELGSAALGGFLEPPPLQPLDHTSISQMRKDLEAAHQKQLHAKGDHSP